MGSWAASKSSVTKSPPLWSQNEKLKKNAKFTLNFWPIFFCH